VASNTFSPDAAAEGAGPDDSGTGRVDGSGTEDGQGGCTPDRVVCGSACTDLQADPLNCGQCGKACDDGQTCSEGKCTVLCVSDKEKCDETCVDTSTDPLHCGTCPNACAAGLLCAAGTCSVDCGALSKCLVLDGGTDGGEDGGAPQYCANLTSDRNNCGACGNVCKVNEICTASSCKPVCATTSRIGDVFATNMYGCVAQVEFSNRAGVCPAGATVCTGQEWVARRATKVPTYNYWTNDDLRWSGSDGNCTASRTQGQLCGNFRATPMRVCGKKTDPVGNQCRWTNCGFNARTPNQYFGGCEDNRTAGTLCCTP
jgi:hypothetical protein